jgi:hypothetical protein
MTAKLPAGCDIDELIQLGEIGHVTRILERLSENERRARVQRIHRPDALHRQRFRFPAIRRGAAGGS